MLLLGGAAVAGFGYAVKSAASFEQQLSRFGAVGNATEQQMERIRQKALQLGQDSAYGATEVVQAFAELAYAGATTKEIMDGLGDATVYLAAAGEIPLADAATTLINTMKQFNIPASESVKIANEISRAANASTISVTDLVTSLRYAGPVASQAGISFNSTAEALAILGNEGIRGSTAGTSLRGILVGITKPSAEATAKMKELGIITKDGANQFFNLDGTMRSFSDIAQVLQNQTKGLTKEQQLNAFGVIFQRRAMASAAILAREGAAGFDSLTNSQQYNTNAQELMKKKLDNLNGSLKILKASFQTLMIVIGSQFTPGLKAIADVLREVVNAFIRLPDPVQKLIGSLLLFGGSGLIVAGSMAKIAAVATRTFKGLNDVGQGFRLLGGLVSNFVRGMQLLGTTLLANPIFLLIVALVALAVIFYLLYTRSETFRRGIQRIGEAAKIAGQWILGAFKTAWEWIKANWPDLLLILLGPVGAAIIAWRHFKTEILGALQAVWNWIKSNWDILAAILLGPFGVAILVIRRFGDDIARIFSTMVNKVVGFINRIPYYFGYMIGFLIAGAVLLQVRLIQLFVRLWGRLLDLITEFTIKALKALGNFLESLPGLFVAALTAVLTFAISFVEQMIAKFFELGTRVILAIITFFGQLPGLIFSYLTTALGMFLGWIEQMVSSMFSGGARIISAAVDFASRLPGMILGAVGDGYHLLFDWARNIMHGLIDGLESLADKAKGIAGDIAGGVIGGVKSIGKVLSPSKVMFEVGQNYMQGFINGLQDVAGDIQPLVASVGGTTSALGTMAPAYTPPATAGATWAQPAGPTNNITVNNPVAETAEESISRTMQKLAYVGIAG